MKQRAFIGIAAWIIFGAVALVQLQAKSPPRVIAIYAPKPEYPALSNGELPEGSGLFVIHINPKTGLVRSVLIEKSTGYGALDAAAISCLKRWKFTKGTPVVKVPFTFTSTGTIY